MSGRTAFLSKLIGIYCILVALSMAINKEATLQAVVAAVHSPAVALVFGLILVGVGLAVILSHNVWSGGAVPVIVTLVGWLTLIKGLLFLFLPPPAAVGILLWGSAYERFFYLDVGLVIVLGVYLTYAGFKFR
jgi:vacuolar-type H+-ATPase subunit I/STV1